MARLPSDVGLLELQQSFREVWETLKPLLTDSLNMDGRRIVNVGNAQQSSDVPSFGQVVPVRKEQADLAGYAATLGPLDEGLLVHVTDFNHVLRWTGIAWGFGPGDAGGGYIAGFVAVPPGSGWVLCNGGATSYLKADGTTQSFTTPNLTGHYLKFAATYTATAAAGGATGTPSATTTVDNDLVVSTVAVASNVHTHAPGTLDLARTGLIPYFRR